MINYECKYYMLRKRYSIEKIDDFNFINLIELVKVRKLLGVK